LRVAILQFPGSNCDLDVLYVLRRVLGVKADLVWHKFFDGSSYDAVILPGGFSYGDSLRSGAIAAHSPAMKKIKDMAYCGKPVLGICNGFQILVESELLPGALMQNDCLTFVCKWVTLRAETNSTAFTRLIPRGSILHMPVAHHEGRYMIDEGGYKELCRNDQIVFRYADEKGELSKKSNPNGSMDNIAGICNKERNVVGLMPHPERASEKAVNPYGTNDGLLIFESMFEFIRMPKTGRKMPCQSLAVCK